MFVGIHPSHEHTFIPIIPNGDWKAVPSVLHDLQDPALFIDDDERAYMYWGLPTVGLSVVRNLI